MTRPRLALVPLDERPVNTQLVMDVAAIAGWAADLPPADALPNFRTPANTAAVAEWLAERLAAPEVRAAVVSLDTFVGGGLIPMRTSEEPITVLIARLGVLRSLALEHPELPIAAISLVTRASDSYSPVEEPDYWSRFGRDLHRLGGDAHRAWEGRTGVRTEVPGEIRRDFSRRRLRNHVLTLAALALHAEGVLARLDITADDTAPYSAGSVEQEWLRYWGLLDPALAVPVRPGADETGAVVAARIIAEQSGHAPGILVDGDPAGWVRTPPFENVPLSDSLERQLAAAGAQRTDDDRAEVSVVVHPPDPDRGDHFAVSEPREDQDAIDDTVSRIESQLSSDRPVVVADVRFVNGGDAGLVRELRDRGLLPMISGYAGWNTAGNSLGSAIATAVAIAAGLRTGSFDERAARRALHRRLLDDVAYQSEIRRECASRLFDDSIAPVDRQSVERAEATLTSLLRDRAESWSAEPPARVTLPWSRSFEVGITLPGE